VDERDLIDALCGVRPEWAARRDAIHEADLYHLAGARLGRELIEAVLGGRDAAWMRRAFEVIEAALARGTPGAKNLVVTGLFEAMQGPAYRRASPPDQVDAWLGAASREAWADLIEGWTGEGVRSIEAWRRVVVNGPSRAVELTTAELRLRADLGESPSVIWQRGEARGGRPLGRAEIERVAAPVRPLVARRLLDPAEAALGEVVARLEVDGARGRAVIEFGAAAQGGQGGRVARCGDRLFAVDLDELAAAWAWLAEG
jgi:hypothetical protein